MPDLLGTPDDLKERMPDLFAPTFPEKGAMPELLGTRDHLEGRMFCEKRGRRR